MLESLEAKQAEFGEQLADPETYKGDPTKASALGQELKSVEAEIETAYARWEELEGRA
jgi:ATP-binding cassette subfamily F protein uup